MFNDVWLVALEDGSTQVTHDGRPLCYDGRPLCSWQRDTEARQTTGHGVSDIWWVVDVSGSLPAAE